jgi:hypothetical protein
MITEDVMCGCGHWNFWHAHEDERGACETPGCNCLKFIKDETLPPSVSYMKVDLDSLPF